MEDASSSDIAEENTARDILFLRQLEHLVFRFRLVGPTLRFLLRFPSTRASSFLFAFLIPHIPPFARIMASEDAMQIDEEPPQANGVPNVKEGKPQPIALDSTSNLT